MAAYVSIHVPVTARMEPVERFPAHEGRREFICVRFEETNILLTVEQGRQMAEELLRAVCPSEIWGPIASEETTRAALEASRQ